MRLDHERTLLDARVLWAVCGVILLVFVVPALSIAGRVETPDRGIEPVELIGYRRLGDWRIDGNVPALNIAA